MTTLITGLIGMAMVIIFEGFMVVWVPAPPLIIIVLGVAGLMIWDFIRTIRSGETGV